MKKTTLFNVLLSAVPLAMISCESSEKGKEHFGSHTNYENHSLMHDAKEMFQPLPEKVLTDANSLTPERIHLGKVLFYDKRLSKNNTQSCNSCHTLSTFGVDNKSFSEGDLGKLGGRNSPTVYNAALHSTQFWDGRAKDVEEQAGMPILNPVEMNIPNEKFLVDRLQKVVGYQKLFAAAYPHEKDPINYKNIRLAIGAFERTLLTPSPFDRYLAGDTKALTDAEKTGLKEFMDVGCATCHNGKAVGGMMLQKFPAKREEYMTFTGSKKEDLGKMEVTKDENDKFVFKVPSLLNITETAPYFHDGSVKDLDHAIRIMGEVQLDKQLTDEQVKNIQTFLLSLKGELSPKATVAPVLP